MAAGTCPCRGERYMQGTISRDTREWTSKELAEAAVRARILALVRIYFDIAARKAQKSLTRGANSAFILARRYVCRKANASLVTESPTFQWLSPILLGLPLHRRRVRVLHLELGGAVRTGPTIDG